MESKYQVGNVVKLRPYHVPLWRGKPADRQGRGKINTLNLATFDDSKKGKKREDKLSKDNQQR